MINVLLATYNEAETIITTLRMLRSTLKGLQMPYEIIVVDGNSPDGTSGIVEREKYPDVRVVKEKCKAGLGASYREGVEECRYEYTVIMDADLQHDPRDIPVMLRKCLEGYDIIVGTRYGKGGKTSKRPFIRKFISVGANNIGRYVIGLQTSDITGSYRCYRTEVLRKLIGESRSKGFGIQVELIGLGEKRGYKIGEVPITFYDRIGGATKFGVREMGLFLLMIFYLYFKL